MPFTPIKFESGKLIERACATTQTIVKGDALADNTHGYLALATSSTTNVPFVAMETQTTTANGDMVLCITTENVEFLADCDAAAAQTDVGTLCDLADEESVNPDSSTHDVFEITGIEGAVGTSTVVRGKFRMQTDA